MSQPTIRVLSLGAGVQSTTLLLMACEGKFVPGLDAAIFADTKGEPQRVYDHLTKLEAVAADAGIPVFRVSRGDLAADATSPGAHFSSVPYFVRNPDGSEGMARRQCTQDYKLAVINRRVRQLLGASPPAFRSVLRGRIAEQWVGFSSDEIGRVSDKGKVAYLRVRYPLIELGMDRKACERWLRSRGWGSVAKSACVFCPYHGNRRWRDMRDNQPEEWAKAIAFDEAIRKGGGSALPLNGEAFLHRSRVPLADAPIDRVTSAEWKSRQGDLLDVLADMEMAEEGDPDGCSPYGCRSGARVGAA